MNRRSLRRLVLVFALAFSFLALAFPTTKTEATCAPQCAGCDYKKQACEAEATMTYQICINDGGYTAICWILYYDTYGGCVLSSGCVLND